jgi:hypothetical protein
VHRSRPTALGIDVPADVHEATAAFWAGALGGRAEADETGTYLDVGRFAGLDVFVQRLGSGSARYHLDIETDDVDAEVARLEALGATRVEQVETWWVMRDPVGDVFCVVGPQSDDFPGDDAATWP